MAATVPLYARPEIVLGEQCTNLVGDYVHYGVMGRPGGLPAAGYLSGFYNSGTLVVVACIGFIALLTPTGALPSRRWRWWTSFVVAALGSRRIVAAGTQRTWRPSPGGSDGSAATQTSQVVHDPGLVDVRPGQLGGVRVSQRFC